MKFYDKLERKNTASFKIISSELPVGKTNIWKKNLYLKHKAMPELWM